MTAAQTAFTNSLIRQHLVHDSLVVLGLFVLAVGSLLPFRFLNQERFHFGSGSSFTDAALNRAGNQVEETWGLALAEFTFELGWSGEGVAVASLWNRFIDQPQHQILDQKFESIAQGVTQEESVVLGISTAPEPANELVTQIGPWYSAETSINSSSLSGLDLDSVVLTPVSEPYQDPDQAQSDQTTPVNFKGLSTIQANPAQAEIWAETLEPVAWMEFYLDSFLVTTDPIAPFFLGGDTDGYPLGYDMTKLAPGTHWLQVKGYSDQGELIVLDQVEFEIYP